MKHFIHKVTMHYGGKAASASITFTELAFDGNLNEELKNILLTY